MFHLKSFLYGEVQVDTWADYSVSDRAAIRQQMQLHGHGSQGETTTTTDAGKVRLSVRLCILLFLTYSLCLFKAFRNIETDFDTSHIFYTT